MSHDGSTDRHGAAHPALSRSDYRLVPRPAHRSIHEIVGLCAVALQARQEAALSAASRDPRVEKRPEFTLEVGRHPEQLQPLHLRVEGSERSRPIAISSWTESSALAACSAIVWTARSRMSRSRRAIAETLARGSVDRSHASVRFSEWGKPRNGLPQRGSLGPDLRRKGGSSHDRMEIGLPWESAH